MPEMEEFVATHAGFRAVLQKIESWIDALPDRQSRIESRMAMDRVWEDAAPALANIEDAITAEMNSSRPDCEGC